MYHLGNDIIIRHSVLTSNFENFIILFNIGNNFISSVCWNLLLKKKAFSMANSSMHSPFLSSNRTNRVWTLSPNWNFSLLTLLCIHLAHQAVTGAYLFVLTKILQFSSDRQNCRARIGFLLLNLLYRLSYCQINVSHLIFSFLMDSMLKFFINFVLYSLTIHNEFEGID